MLCSCAGPPCAQVAKFVPPATSKPVITLLPSANPMFVQYGKTPSVYLGACQSADKNTTCGAVAYDVDTKGKKTDITQYIVVSTITACDAAATAEVCSFTLCFC